MNAVLENPILTRIRSKARLHIPGIRHAKRKGMICPAGSLASALSKALIEAGLEITGLLDSNEDKCGTTLGGLPVLPIPDAGNNSSDFGRLATMSFRDEIT